MLKKIRANIYQAAWLIALACFVCIGLNAYRNRHDIQTIEGTGPNCSTDSILKTSLGISGATEKINAALEQLPKNMRPVVVFWPNINGNAIISYQIASYLTWPREAWSVPMDRMRIGRAVEDFKKAQFGAMMFYILKPPEPEPDSTVIGAMTIVPLETNQK